MKALMVLASRFIWNIGISKYDFGSREFRAFVFIATVTRRKPIQNINLSVAAC